jgi:hypothetical protein
MPVIVLGGGAAKFTYLSHFNSLDGDIYDGGTRLSHQRKNN